MFSRKSFRTDGAAGSSGPSRYTNLEFVRPRRRKKRQGDDEPGLAVGVTAREALDGLPRPPEVLGAGLRSRTAPEHASLVEHEDAPAIKITPILRALLERAIPARTPAALAPIADDAKAASEAARAKLPKVDPAPARTPPVVVDPQLRDDVVRHDLEISDVQRLAQRLQADYETRVAELDRAVEDLRRQQKALRIAVENQRRAALLAQELLDPV